MKGSDLVCELQSLGVVMPRCARLHHLIVVRYVLRPQALLIHVLRLHKQVLVFFRSEILPHIADMSGVCNGSRVHQQVSFLRRTLLDGEIQPPKGLL